MLAESADQVIEITDQDLKSIGITQQQFIYYINLLKEDGLIKVMGFSAEYISITMRGLQYLEDNRKYLSSE